MIEINISKTLGRFHLNMEVKSDSRRIGILGGSGIGLSIVKKIVEEHGGKIWATSREGTGTTMYFVLRKYQEVPIHLPWIS